ncbi:glycoside hydrolase family 3 protein [Anaeromassilibacillus sp. An250]|uniref:glycoside hydrolase family 3 protein n=1 Tax=Anaeromassilibacillus sp. An250 TaxID=1965604 RepID=UPI001123320B|nr:glycoside hydrolase family 3 N-terminal domain-containing protein [Anaeromassilibacillus sp. An250]
MKRRSVLFLMIAVLLLFAVGCAAGPAKTEEPNSSSSSMSVPSESESSAPPAETEERPEEPEGSASEESDASSSGQSAVPAGPATTQELFAEGYPEAQELLENMTLEEKVAQVFLFRCPSENALAAVQTYQPGGFMLFAKDFDGKTAEQVCAEMESYQQASKIPMFLAVDEEGGTVVRVSRNANLAPKPFQSPQQVFQSGGMQAIVDDTVQKTQLLQSLGLNVNLAPVADVSTNPADFMYARTFGQGAAETADYVKNSVATYNQQRMACALKHFPGYGNNVDTHTGIAVDHRPYETFMESDFLPFAAGIEEGAPMVLVSHNIVNCMDSEHPASLSPEVHRVLREDLGFTGLILTDDLSMEAIPAYTGGENPCAAAINAGNDLLLSSDLQADYNALSAAVQDGTVTEERLDESVLRILAMKCCTQYQLERVVG